MILSIFSLICFGLGGLGILGSTVLFPLISGFTKMLTRYWSAAGRSPVTGPSRVLSLDIFIAARNEEEQIASTLESIRSSVAQFKAKQSEEMRIRVIVGADASDDRTAEIAAQFADQVFEFDNHSKWKTIQSLLKTSEAEWVALVDVGTVWPREFLRRFHASIKSPDIYAFSPGYKVEGKRVGLTSLLWGFERLIKKIENFSGGPVSVHGATVLYKREPLSEVMTSLESRVWYNDDVVLPLALRARFGRARILYSTDPDVMVEDRGTAKDQVQGDFRRRLRLAVGNIQWMTALLNSVFTQSREVGVLGLRRLFRVFWAWWIGLLLVAICFELGARTPVLGLMTPLLFLAVIYSLRGLRNAFAVSLIAPVLFWLDNGRSIRWK